MLTAGEVERAAYYGDEMADGAWLKMPQTARTDTPHPSVRSLHFYGRQALDREVTDVKLKLAVKAVTQAYYRRWRELQCTSGVEKRVG